MQTRFVALVPVKSPEVGKSRLSGVDAVQRRALALAFALDTLEAVRVTPCIDTTVVVTSDDEVAGLARTRGCLVAPDLGDLNGSLRAAAAAHTGMLAAVCADLPALRSDDLADALAQVRAPSTAYVSDADGTGTTTYCAPVGTFDPRFGPGSASAHRDRGALAVQGDLPTLRRDVDTMDDLLDLSDRGLLGPHTAATLAPIISLRCRA